MNCVIVDKICSYSGKTDGITVYHAAMFHGAAVNAVRDDNHFGDVLTNRLHLEKNAYDCRYVIQPARNLIVPESFKEKLAGVRNVNFYEIVFDKLFFHPFCTGDLSLGPETYNEMDEWLASFPNEPRLQSEVESFYELILPSLELIQSRFPDAAPVRFRVEPWRESELHLSAGMVAEFPIIWTREGILFREDVFRLVEDAFSWKYFRKAGLNLGSG